MNSSRSTVNTPKIFEGRTPQSRDFSSSHGQKAEPAERFSVRQFEPKFLGENRYRFKNGDIWEFTGEIHNKSQILNTQGKYTLSNTGAVYSGIFVQGKIVGSGEAQYADGNRLVGFWSEKGCEGTLMYASGDCYSGGLAESVRCGFGVCEFVNGVSPKGTRLPRFIPTTLHSLSAPSLLVSMIL